MMNQNKKEYWQTVAEYIKHKQLQEEIHINRFKQLHINQAKIIVQF